MDVDLDGIKLVKKRRRNSGSSQSSISSTQSAVLKSPHTGMAIKTYCLFLRFYSVPDVPLISKGLRSLQLDVNVNLIRMGTRNFKILVTNPHAMNKLLLTSAVVPKDWSTLGKFYINIYGNHAETAWPASYTFVIKNVDMSISDEELKTEVNENG